MMIWRSLNPAHTLRVIRVLAEHRQAATRSPAAPAPKPPRRPS